ncbi:MAG: hypothetical protein ACOX8M_09220 [Marvinbryantia sp.]|jgi:hypothetical protein
MDIRDYELEIKKLKSKNRVSIIVAIISCMGLIGQAIAPELLLRYQEAKKTTKKETELKSETEMATKRLEESTEKNETDATRKETEKVESNSIVWLEELTPLTCIAKWGDDGGSMKYERWTNQKDNRGESYDHGIYVGESQGSLRFTEIKIEYYLEEKYSNISGCIVLSEQGKDHLEETKIKIILDENYREPKFITEKYVSSGFTPESFDIDVQGVDKIAFVLDAEGEWFWGLDFGLVDVQLECT